MPALRGACLASKVQVRNLIKNLTADDGLNMCDVTNGPFTISSSFSVKWLVLAIVWIGSGQDMTNNFRVQETDPFYQFFGMGPFLSRHSSVLYPGLFLFES